MHKLLIRKFKDLIGFPISFCILNSLYELLADDLDSVKHKEQ